MKKILALVCLALSINANAQLKTTNGVIGYSVETPTSRADIPSHSGEYLEVKIRYLGPTDQKELFADGTYQEQVGIKLRSANGCNVIYVMRRIAPNPSISVSIKSNPGLVSVCGDKGYTMIKSIPVLPPKLFSEFVLNATIVNNEIRVLLDNKEIIKAKIPDTIKGDAGIRTDNTKIIFTYK
jgi:hypothetical protein